MDTRPRALLVVIASAHLLFCAGKLSGQTPIPQTLTNNSGLDYYQFGNAVDIDGTRLIVGEFQDIPEGESTVGAAFIYNRSGSTWSLQTSIVPSGSPTDANFGRSVAIDGDKVVVGAYNEQPSGCDAKDGAAYLFSRTQQAWNQASHFVASDCVDEADAGDRYGTSVAKHNALIVVGAYLDDSGEMDEVEASGSAYIYRLAGGWQETKLTLEEPIQYQVFGRSVSVSGNYVVIGAPYGEQGIQQTPSPPGSAYVYETENGGATWSDPTELTEDLNNGAHFGIDVSIDADRIIIGANAADNEGAAYVYERSDGNNWGLMGMLQPSELVEGDNFGVSVSIHGDYAIVGANFRNDFQGVAYVYHYDDVAEEWGEPIFTLTEGAAGDQFGRSVSIQYPYVVVGAPNADHTGETNNGKAYVYNLDEEPEHVVTSEGPATSRLGQNHPNPFNPTTVISYQLTSDDIVNLKVYDMLGREVISLVEERQAAGYHQVTLNASQLASGMYFYRLSAGKFTEVKKLLVVK